MSTVGDRPEDCPVGSQCGIHYRVNARTEEGGWFLVYTDYVGNYVILTSILPGLDKIGALIAPLVGIETYDTMIIRVGSRTLHDAMEKAEANGVPDHELIAWEERYSTFEEAQSGHDMVVSAFRGGLLSLEV